MLQKTHLGSRLVSLAASFALCVACGGGSDGGGAGGAGAAAGSAGTGSTATFSSSVPANEQLSTISDQDSATLCKEIDAFESGANSAKLEDFSCRLTALLAAAISGSSTDAGLQGACKTAYDACVATPPSSTTSTTTCTKPDATCTATVAELEACLNDSGPYIDQVLGQLPSCAALTEASLSSDTSTSTPMSPASCTTFQAKCPNSDVPLPGAGT
jgi:hypothetical protein